MNKIETFLLDNKDDGYALFQEKLIPGLEAGSVIGVRVPVLREFAKGIYKAGEYEEFLQSLPHKYLEENMLHSILLSFIKDFDEALRLVDEFLPYVDNWAVCDILSPKAFKNNHDRLLPEIKRWASSEETYTCRFGIEMLMANYLDNAFSPELLAIPASVRMGEYYVDMMVAWYYATALAKQWEDSVKYIEERRLPEQVHRKTITKACESFRVTPEHKAYLKTFR